MKPAHFFDTEIGQASHKTYGVGMPIQLTFDRAISNRSAVEKALEVTTSKPVVGAWHWLDSRHLNFRPQNYWPANTTVTVRGHFNGVAGTSTAYGKDVSQTFTIGRSLIVVASTKTHHMAVYKNGKLLYNWKISTGRPGHSTPNGTYLTINKANPVRMRPADVQKGESGYYDLEVPWAVRFTWSGIFMHDAYWSVGDQGHSNVSHGCVNMSPSNSKTYYQMELPGDPVTVTGSPLAGDSSDGWTDWFLGWSDVLSKSATHLAVQAGPQGSQLVDPKTLPADPGKAPVTTSQPHNAHAS
jgi:lipoprotein-anchoring transpeptidase ErfK/SrfK